ncbi:Os02g0616666 [Oryza sativa Japonica Group]|uniref:Os02g0616666 protein n=1 Tax=Oryza sativa subsp. japonica TaxID=39947 RepID=C7IYW9_ORYSJ|nr:Os02g0616666 [Oryza sativa Japonica Group]|eukprot:NP_001173078.1 Os02g0616666 [Oryza sativa Japonica Group]
MFLAVVNEAQSLRQLDATVDEFFRKMSAVWRQMDLQGADVCRTCTCCQRQRVQTETTRLYEFLSRLRPEFEPVRAQLLARRPRPSLLETLPELRAEETRCREAGIGIAQQSTSVLVAQGLPSQVHVSAQPVVVPSPLPVAAGAPSTPSGIVCGYCSKTGHTASMCYKKKRDQSHRTSQGSRQGSSQSSSQQITSTEQELVRLLRRLMTTASTSTHGSAAQASSLPPPPPSSSGILSSWFLDSGASFHMTPDSTHLSSMSPPDTPLTVQTANGTSLPVVDRGTLSTSSFRVPTVSHVPKLTMQLMSAGQITDHGCRIILEADSCCVQDRRTGLLVGTGPRRHDSQRLWELDWLHLPSDASTSQSVGSTASATEHKGYRCYDPVARRMRISRHVTFDESRPYYPRSSTCDQSSTVKSISFLTLPDWSFPSPPPVPSPSPHLPLVSTPSPSLSPPPSPMPSSPILPSPPPSTLLDAPHELAPFSLHYSRRSRPLVELSSPSILGPAPAPASRYDLRDRHAIRPAPKYGFTAAAIVEPTTYREAIAHQEWQQAMAEEIAALELGPFNLWSNICNSLNASVGVVVMGGINHILMHNWEVPCAAEISLKASSYSAKIPIVEGEVKVFTDHHNQLYTSHLKLSSKEGQKEVKVRLYVDGFLALTAKSCQVENEEVLRDEKGETCTDNDKVTRCLGRVFAVMDRESAWGLDDVRGGQRSCGILRLELMHVVDGDSIWHTMELLCAYGMRSRIWKESKFVDSKSSALVSSSSSLVVDVSSSMPSFLAAFNATSDDQLEQIEEEDLALVANRIARAMNNARNRKRGGPNRCFECDSIDHLRSHCPKLGRGKREDKDGEKTNNNKPNNYNKSKGSNQGRKMENLRKAFQQVCAAFEPLSDVDGESGDDDNGKNVSDALVARKENVWIVDSGCSRHMTGDKNWFSSLKKASKTESIVFADASTSAVVAIGLVKVNEKFELKNVALVKDLKYNLLSVSQIVDENSEVHFKKTGSKVFDSCGDSVLNISRYGRAFKADFENSVSPVTTCLVAKFDKDVMFWHCRLGHVGFDHLTRLSGLDLVRGLPKLKKDLDLVQGEDGRIFEDESDYDDDDEIEMVLQRIQLRPVLEQNVDQLQKLLLLCTFNDDIRRNKLLYTKDLLRRFKMENCKPISTPIGSTAVLDPDEDGEAVDQKEYRMVLEMIGFTGEYTGDSMSRESICGDGPGVGLGIRRRPWWSEIMRDT